jgi:hypothetical protein
MTDIPKMESITASWLTERLHEAGHRSVNVRDFTRTQIGTGQIGKCIRFGLELEGEDTTAPRSLVGKFPSDDPLSRATGVALKNYIKEVSFYRGVQSKLSISTPRCYYADIEGEGPHFALLLRTSVRRAGRPARRCSQTSRTPRYWNRRPARAELV